MKNVDGQTRSTSCKIAFEQRFSNTGARLRCPLRHFRVPRFLFAEHMRKVGNLLYWVAFAAGATFLVGNSFQLEAGGLFTGANALIAFCAAFLLSIFEKGNKTALQKIFLAFFGCFATGAIVYSLGWIGWVGACISMFMVATMKLDGGDRDAG